LIQKHKYLTLDAIRGVAALFVVIRHLSDFFGGIQFPHSHLAVDLFFVMSGFVLSAAYDKDLVSGKLSTTNFLKIRAVRLYPLYFMGTALFFIGELLLSVFGSLHGSIHHPGTFNIDLLFEVLLGLLLIPSPVPGISLFPLNGPSWSIFFEVITNGFYARFREYLTKKMMLYVLGVSGGGLVISVFLMSNLDFGNTWQNSFGGLPRVFYSFTAGLMVYRIHQNIRIKIQFNNLNTLLVLSLVIMLLGFPITLYTEFYELIVVLVIFPILVLTASFVEPTPNAKLGKIFATMGLTSYAIYILQAPFIWAFSTIFVKYKNTSILWPGVIAVAVLFVLSLSLDLFYDQPARRWMRNKYLGAPSKVALFPK